MIYCKSCNNPRNIMMPAYRPCTAFACSPHCSHQFLLHHRSAQSLPLGHWSSSGSCKRCRFLKQGSLQSGQRLAVTFQVRLFLADAALQVNVDNSSRSPNGSLGDDHQSDVHSRLHLHNVNECGVVQPAHCSTRKSFAALSLPHFVHHTLHLATPHLPIPHRPHHPGPPSRLTPTTQQLRPRPALFHTRGRGRRGAHPCRQGTAGLVAAVP